jgi:hypothetical protein
MRIDSPPKVPTWIWNELRRHVQRLLNFQVLTFVPSCLTPLSHALSVLGISKRIRLSSLEISSDFIWWLLTVMVESLTQRTKAWEDERGLPFMFDGVHLPTSMNQLLLSWALVVSSLIRRWISLCMSMVAGAVTIYAEWIQASQGREGRGKTPAKGNNQFRTLSLHPSFLPIGRRTWFLWT